MQSQTIDALCHQARQAIAERNWERAKQAYQEALGIKSDAPDVHQGLATVCFQMRDLNGAAYHFKEVTRLDPLRAGAFINLGAVYNLLDRLDDAAGALRRGIQLDAQRGEGYYNLGLVYRRKGQTDLAIHAYKEALRVNPRMADAHYNLGNLYLDKQHYVQAADAYRQALAVRAGWDKALQGLEHARAAMAEASLAAETIADTPDEPAQQPVVAAAKLPADPRRTVNAEAQGQLLTSLHKATVESDSHGRHFQEVVENEVEPCIKELSSCLIAPDVSPSTLDACIQRFESALLSMRSAHEHLHHSIDKVRELGNRLVSEEG